MEKFCDQVIRNPSTGRIADDDYRCFTCPGDFIGRNNKPCIIYVQCVAITEISYSASLTTTPFFAPAIVIRIS